MHIEKIVYSGGLEVTNISKEKSSKVSLLLFGESKPQQTSPAKPRRHVGYRSRRWTDAEDTMLRSMKERHVPAPVIARQLNRSTAAVYTRASQLGIKRQTQTINA